MRLAVVNLTPGTAKTTCALHIAAAMAGDGGGVLVDADPRATAADLAVATGPHRFGLVRHAGSRLHHHIDALVGDAEHVVIDTPPGDPTSACSAILAADAVLIPVPASGAALATTLALVERIAALRPLPARVLAVRTTDGGGRPRLPRGAAASVMDATVPLFELAGLAHGMEGPAAALAPVVDELLADIGSGRAAGWAGAGPARASRILLS